MATWLDKKIRDYDAKEFADELTVALAEIVFLTGGKMYDEETERDMYTFQLRIISKFLLESFGFLSFAEMKNAFYLNNSGKFPESYSHYGREMNIEYIGNVLSAYRLYKKQFFNDEELRRKLEKVLIPLEEKPQYVWTDNDYANMWREQIENAYQRLITDLDMNDEHFPEFFYNTLEADGIIEKNCYEKKMEEAKLKLGKDYQIERMRKMSEESKGGSITEPGRSDVTFTESGIDLNFNDPKVIGERQERYADTRSIADVLTKIRKLKFHPVITVSKQMIVKELFLDFMGKGKIAIYEKIQ